MGGLLMATIAREFYSYNGEWVPFASEPPVPPVTSQITLVYEYFGTSAVPRFSVSGDYQVDWGDGTAVEPFLDGVTATHTYAAAGPYSAVVTPVGQEMTSFLNNPSGAAGALQPTEILFDCATLTEINVHAGVNVPAQYLSKVEFVSPPSLPTCRDLFKGEEQLREVAGTIGAGVTVFSGMFSGCNRLLTLPQLDTSSGTDFSDMFNGCTILSTIPLFDTSNGTTFERMFEGCRAIETIPLFDTSAGETFAWMFKSCVDLTSVPLLDTSSGIWFNNMFDTCSTLTTIPLFNTSSGIHFHRMMNMCELLTSFPLIDTSQGTSFEFMFNRCFALPSVPALDASSGVSCESMFQQNSALTSILATGFRYSVGVVETALDAAAINTFFTNLGTAAGTQTVTITGTLGAATCDRTIAQAKGWTVTG